MAIGNLALSYETVDISSVQSTTYQATRPKPTRTQWFAAAAAAFLPYLGGVLVIWTRQIGWLAIAGGAITVTSTCTAYILRRSTDPVTATQRLLVDPLLYGFEFALTATLIRYVLMR